LNYLNTAVVETFCVLDVPAMKIIQGSRCVSYVNILWPRGGESRRGCPASGLSGLGKMYFRFSKFRILMENPVLLTKSSDSREWSSRIVLLVLSLECCSPFKDCAGTEFKVIKLLNTGLTGLLAIL